MKRIGLIGGMSWESTVVYYELLNHLARERLGGLHSANLLLWSFDFAEIAALQADGNWNLASERMIEAARSLEKGGADCIVICTNTMHKMAEEVQACIDVPLIHIADVVAEAIKHSTSNSPVLLATRFTMEQDFYRGHLYEHHGVKTLVPDESDRAVVHDIIYNELCQGVVHETSKAQYLEVVGKSQENGADGVIFGCTEVGLLVSPDDFDVPTFNTTELHALAAMDFALS